jgi:[methyl-Co(III) methanol-specific corrinoid protein]:coenzyme M methyltransferase
LPAVSGAIWKNVEDIQLPDDFLVKRPIKTVRVAIRLLREEFGNRVGIIGKIYGPWSLAFHTFGISEFLLDTIRDPQKVKAILHRLKEVSLIFADAQIEAGVDALNVCDHITGNLVNPKAYPQFLLEIHQEFSKKISCPLILHCCGKTLDRIEYFNQSGMACYNFESANDAKAMRAQSNMVLLGNINNVHTILEGSKEDVKKEVFYALDAGIEIIGPECAVPVNGKLANIIAIREAVEEYFEKKK